MVNITVHRIRYVCLSVSVSHHICKFLLYSICCSESLHVHADICENLHRHNDDGLLLFMCSSDKRASRPGSAHSNLTDLSQESSRDRDPDRPRTAQRRSDSKSSGKETIIFG